MLIERWTGLPPPPVSIIRYHPRASDTMFGMEEMDVRHSSNIMRNKELRRTEKIFVFLMRAVSRNFGVTGIEGGLTKHPSSLHLRLHGWETMTRVKRMALVDTPKSAPRYELRVRGLRPGDTEYEIWQMPSAATPQITSATGIAGLRGQYLEPVEHRALKRFGSAGIEQGPSRRRERCGRALTKDLTPTLGLLSRALEPMRSRQQHADGGRRHRRYETEGSGLLARHGDTPQPPAPGAHGVALPSDRAEAMSGAPIAMLSVAQAGFPGIRHSQLLSPRRDVSVAA